MKKARILVTVTALVALLFAGITFSATANAEGSIQTDRSQNQALLREIDVINPQEILLVGSNLDLRGKSITITGKDGSSFMAQYDMRKNTFVIINGTLAPGVAYKVSASWVQVPKSQEVIAIPLLMEANQVAPNQIQIVYDQPVDLASGTKANNYWVQSNQEKAAGIATIGKTEMDNLTNSLTSDMVMIKPADNSKKRFIMTFRVKATSGVQYRVLPCFVSMEGRTHYTGGNYTKASKNTFVAN